MQKGQVHLARQVLPGHSLIKALLPLQLGVVVLVSLDVGGEGSRATVFANADHFFASDAGLRPAGPEGDVVEGEVVAEATGGVVAQREDDGGLAGCRSEGETVGVPGAVFGNGARSKQRYPIDAETHVRCQAVCTGHQNVAHIGRELVEGVFAEIVYPLLVEFTGREGGVNYHHVPIRVVAVVRESIPGGKGRIPNPHIIGDGIKAIIGWRVGLVQEARGDARVWGEDGSRATAEVSGLEDVLTKIARTLLGGQTRTEECQNDKK